MSEDNNVKSLVSGMLQTEQVNPFTWVWYEVPLVDYVNGTSVFYNAVVSVDSESISAMEETWTTFDVLVLNGTLPGNAQTGEEGPVTNSNPYCWIGEECPHAHVLRYEAKSRVTASFGFNYTAPGGMGPPLSHLVIGVREAGGAQTVTSYSIRMTRLPRIVTDGSVIESAVAPCEADDIDSCRQYFVVPVRAYDILQVTLERTGDNLTLVDPANGEVRSNGGRGFTGHFYVGDPSTYLQPPPLSGADVTRFISNVTSRVSAEYFCTLAHQAGSYTLAVVPGAFGGFGAELLTSAAEMELYSTAGVPGVPRQGRGRFRLRVRHAAFQSGDIPGVGSRPGCLAFGQTRNYTINTTGAGDANLYAQVSGGNISRIRARCAGCDWVEATPPLSALSASPCTMRNATTWELQLSLADPTTATLDGLSPTEFVLSTQLQNATLAPGDTILPRSAGGRGYVCCGAVQSFMVPDVPRTSSLSIELNLTMGHVRAAFLKHGSCADPATDVDGALCKGVCEISWLTVYDEFYGTMEFTRQSSFNVPFGPDPWIYNPLITKRRGGDWYVSLQALPGMAAEYQLGLSIKEPPRAPDAYRCNRFNGFCPQGFYHAGLANLAASSNGAAPSTSSSAPGRSSPGFALASAAISPLLCAFAMVFNLLGAQRGRGLHQ